jgi:hypothetical protein
LFLPLNYSYDCKSFLRKNIDTSNKSLLAREKVGKNSTDRGKNGSKRHILADGMSVPLALAATGANRRNVSRLENLLDSIFMERPDIG